MYFSGTGTTKKMVTYIASELAKKVGYEYEAYDFTPPAVRKEVKSYEQGDIVVLGTPVIAGRVPNLLLKYLDTVAGNGAYGVPVVLFGNRNFDDALIELRNIMEKDGFHTISVHYFRKPEQIVDLLKEQGLPMPTKLMLEGDELPYTEYCRLASLFPEAEVVNGTPLIRQARSVKTPVEIEMFRRSGIAHAKAYEQIPSVYRPSMTDIEFSIEIERLMRLQGCLGIFRVFGRSMEIFMGSVLTGDNAGYPSPYDFALGGQGLDPALPGGANKTPLKEGQSVMVDLGGNFNGYMNDMSRVFSIGKLPEEAYTAHQVCLDIQTKIASIAKPGIACEVLYDIAAEMAKEAGFADKFMGTGQQAKFIGHGIGLEINEAPVLAPRMKQQLEPGMVFALEPKIVIPGVGPVGIENSWVVTNEGIEKLTNCNEEIIELS